MAASTSEQKPVFDYRALRALVGIVAFALPPAVWLISSFARLPSVSASYYTAARDVFVGALFGIAALLLGYNGHTPLEKWGSKVAALAAFVAAILPTSCVDCEPDFRSRIHYFAGTL